MADQSWVIILSVGFFIMALGFSAAIFFLIYASLEIRRISSALRLESISFPISYMS